MKFDCTDIFYYDDICFILICLVFIFFYKWGNLQFPILNMKTEILKYSNNTEDYLVYTIVYYL